MSRRRIKEAEYTEILSIPSHVGNPHSPYIALFYALLDTKSRLPGKIAENTEKKKKAA